ncbi:hypothetical protein SeMB42_g03527 [Synchytrium endobioticum]|uniref:Protein KTI12 n=1 Tax=Synchytrium endobioticum TaxID=286115 RepID=A0A507D649_9FUNG|nr:hypothetical protein SeMB42_g03527 [Synchytrium endobioticum]TPX51248.1 hypothetical protein SeLEV6574_g00376 [Synchytrium endobioticum]
MPLVLMCGGPSTGKSTRARHLQSFLQTYIAEHADDLSKKGVVIKSVLILDDEIAEIDKKVTYTSISEEKNARAALYSAIERLLCRETVVISDWMNYIKGYRYQLYCSSKTMGTPHCILYCGTPVETARSWNAARRDNPYDESIFESLVMRFEEPDPRNRWDSPCFTIAPDDNLVELFGEAIVDAILLKKGTKPNRATHKSVVTETNYLHDLDKSLSDIVSRILEAQKEGTPTSIDGGLPVPRASSRIIMPSRTVTLAELRRLRRQFSSINSTHIQPDLTILVNDFVDYLNMQLHQS